MADDVGFNEGKASLWDRFRSLGRNRMTVDQSVSNAQQVQVEREAEKERKRVEALERKLASSAKPGLADRLEERQTGA